MSILGVVRQEAGQNTLNSLFFPDCQIKIRAWIAFLSQSLADKKGFVFQATFLVRDAKASGRQTRCLSERFSAEAKHSEQQALWLREGVR